MRPTYEGAATAWRDHLAAGGTTPWEDFVPDEDAEGEGPLPPPANLELVRRLNLEGVAFDRAMVFGLASPGRGMVETRLPWPGADADFRTHLQPDSLPGNELTRIAAAVMVRTLRDHAGPPREVTVRPRVHVSGAPIDVARLQATLRPPRHRRWTKDAVVVARPLPLHLTQAWSARVQQGGIMGWVELAAHSATRLPRAASLDALVEDARRWHRPERIHVVFEEPSAGLVAEILGARSTDGRPALAELGPSATEVLRWSNIATRLWPDDGSAARVRSALVEQLPHSDLALAVPARRRPDLRRQAEQVVRRLTDEGAVLHGDAVAWIESAEATGRATPWEADVSDVAIATLVGVLKEVG